ncbi:MAG TPA: hypothetical protein VLI55_00775 [Bryobacteraceae bacterium]|nr:hypothetical protein [Bryobacteraceae bacterium]HXF15319.1 hypothetical protein [Terriglobales bacterium]
MRTVPAEFEQLESQCVLDSNDATEPVNVETVLPDGNRRAVRGIFRGFRGDWLSICTAERIALSTAAAVQYNNALFIGEVLACREMDAAWIIRIKVKRMLTNLQSLMRLRSALLRINQSMRGRI